MGKHEQNIARTRRQLRKSREAAKIAWALEFATSTLAMLEAIEQKKITITQAKQEVTELQTLLTNSG